MNGRIRILALFIVACFALLVAQLTNLQITKATALDGSKYQPPASGVDPWTQPRGEIVSTDGVVLAKSVPTTSANVEQRLYPDGSLFADITGYFDEQDAAIQYGIEQEYNSYLTYHESTANNLHQLLTVQGGTDSVVLTINSHLQQVAANALAGRTGAVVAIDPATGAILAMYGNPTYDPNVLAGPDKATVDEAFTRLEDLSDPGASPLINYATAQRIAPGSTFKVITTSAIFDHDPAIAKMSFHRVSNISLPQTELRLQNFGGEVCGGNLPQILAASCDTSFAKVGLLLGAPALADEALSFGFNQRPPIDLPSDEVTPACFPSAVNDDGTATNPQAPTCPGATPIGESDQPDIAYSAIGQKDVAETALQNALVVAAIGDGGVIMTPHLMSSIIDSSGDVVETYQPHPWLTATSTSTAAAVRTLMLGVTAPGGTAYGDFPANLDVAAKTGTAETGLNGCSATWLVATAPAGPTDTPQIAVAALVPAQNQSECSETGAEVAGPVVAKVIEAYLGSAS